MTASKKRVRAIAIVLSILLFPGLFFIYLGKGDHRFGSLPFYGPKTLIQAPADTAYYQVKNLTAKWVSNDSVFNEDLTGVHTIYEFVGLEARTRKMAEEFLYEPRIRMVTVYAIRHAKELQEIKNLVERSNMDFSKYYMVYDQFDSIVNYFNNEMAPDNEFQYDLKNVINQNTNIYVLVDKNRHIRGYYHIKNKQEASEDIRLLIKEDDKNAYQNK